MRRLALLTALCALLAAPAAASGATSFVVRGAGFGHGIGMSQYGAYGYAQNGWDHRQILAHYYQGTDIGQASKSRVRVLLQSSRPSVSFSGAVRAGSRKLQAEATYVARRSGSGVVIRTLRGRRVARFGAPVRLRSAASIRLGGTALNGVSGGSYRGGMELRAGASGGVTAINVVGLNSYLYGVVPGEMPSSWHPEALAAQAVAARTYAMISSAGGAVFDLYPDTRSQVYKGMSGEAPTTNAAVRATSGEVVTYQGELANTFYFSTSGGRTENIENVWYGSAPVPYLKSVEDEFDDISPRHRWTLRYSRSQMKAKLGSLCSGTFRGIKVRKRGVSPRVVAADVVCGRGTTRTNGTTLRSRLGLYDTWFTVKRVSAARARRSSKTFGAAISKLFFPRVIEGRFSPAPRSRELVIEQHYSDGKWHEVKVVRTTRRGAFSAAVDGPGIYRVRDGGITSTRVVLY